MPVLRTAPHGQNPVGVQCDDAGVRQYLETALLSAKCTAGKGLDSAWAAGNVAVGIGTSRTWLLSILYYTKTYYGVSDMSQPEETLPCCN